MLIARSLELAARLKSRLEQLEYCKVLNAGTCGPAVNWWVLPKGRNAAEIYDAVVAGKLNEARCNATAVRSSACSTSVKGRSIPASTRDLALRPVSVSSHTVLKYLHGGGNLQSQTTDEIVDRIIDSIEETHDSDTQPTSQ